MVVLGAGKTAGAAFTGDALAAINGVLFAMYFLKVKQRRDTGVHSWAQRHLEVSVASLLTLASPVISAVGEWLWLDQPMAAPRSVVQLPRPGRAGRDRSQRPPARGGGVAVVRSH